VNPIPIHSLSHPFSELESGKSSAADAGRRTPATVDRITRDYSFYNKGTLLAGLTLIEVLIALTMTLIVLGAMMTAFQVVSKRMQNGRAVIELSNRLRSVETILRSDLEGLTVEARPYLSSLPPGFLQIVEGPQRDRTAGDLNLANSAIGDVDDLISMTVQSNQMLRGRLENPFALPPVKGVIESPLAEVVWFTLWDWDSPGRLIPDPQFMESVTLRRRILLVIPPSMINYFPNYPILGSNLTWAQVRNFFQINDISARVEPVAANQFNIVANTLGDLAVRKNRFGHFPAFATGNFNPDGSPVINLSLPNQGFPNKIHAGLLAQFTTPRDIVLTDVVGFDIKVYSANAELRQDVSGRYALESHDVGFNEPDLFQIVGPFGGFVNMGDAVGLPGTWFSGPPLPLSFLNGSISSWPTSLPVNVENTFDTWTPAYESDGINQDFALGGWRANTVDSFVNGLDDDGVNGVDDAGERETMPPYPYPIRGIEIQIRAAEKLTKQVQQTTIRHNFVPE